MDDDFDGGFKLAQYPAPCCNASVRPNELNYEWPQGFGRFALESMNRNIGKLDDEHKQVLETVLGTPLRVIYQHV